LLQKEQRLGESLESHHVEQGGFPTLIQHVHISAVLDKAAKPNNVSPDWSRRREGGETSMSKLLRGVAAGWGAKKLRGGGFTTILIFALLWWLLGSFDIFQ